MRGISENFIFCADLPLENGHSDFYLTCRDGNNLSKIEGSNVERAIAVYLISGRDETMYKQSLSGS